MKRAQLSHVGMRSDGRRVYVYSRRPILFAVYAKRHRGKTLELVGRIGEHTRDDQMVWNPDARSWQPADHPLTPREKAEQLVIWWREVGNTEAEMVELRSTQRPEAKRA